MSARHCGSEWEPAPCVCACVHPCMHAYMCVLKWASLRMAEDCICLWWTRKVFAEKLYKWIWLPSWCATFLMYCSIAEVYSVCTEEGSACVLTRDCSFSLKRCSCAGSRACAGCTICICRSFDTSLVCPVNLLFNCDWSLSFKCHCCASSSLCRLWNLYMQILC